MSSICWLIGGFVAFYMQIILSVGADEALIAGIFASFIAFVGAIFMEVTYYSMNGLVSNKIFHRK